MKLAFLTLTGIVLVSSSFFNPFLEVAKAEKLDAKLQPKLDAKILEAKKIAADSKIVAAVKNANSAPAAQAKELNQDKWQKMTILDPFVSTLIKGEVGSALKAYSQKDDSIAEAFVSAADGTKVGFLSKTSGWSHKGKAKHDNPMSNKVWQGDIEVDDSTGVKQIQISVPVLDGGKPIGSLVIGYKIAKL